jgi:hypothetical protein
VMPRRVSVDRTCPCEVSITTIIALGISLRSESARSV